MNRIWITNNDDGDDDDAVRPCRSRDGLGIRYPAVHVKGQESKK